MTDDTPVTETAETPVRDEFAEMSSIFDEAEARDETKASTTVQPDGGQPRGADGKFIPRETPATAPTGDGATEVKPAQGATPGIEAAPVQALAPASWTDAEKAIWPSLTPEAQAAITRRETDWQKADGERAQKLKPWEGISAVLDHVRPRLALHGVNDETYVRQLVAADEFLRRDFKSALPMLAQMYGVNLSDVFQQTAPEQTEVDPVLAPLHQKIATLESTLSNFAQSQQQAERTRMGAVVQTFAANPANKHYGAVEADILAMLPGIMAQTPGIAPDAALKAAYDRAIWANEAVRTQILAEQAKEAEERRKAETAKGADVARRISATNLSSKGTAAGANPVKRSQEEEMSEVFDRLQGAA
jgi:hypothetical protein